MPMYPYQLLKPGNDFVCTTASGDNFFDVCVSVVRTKMDCTGVPYFTCMWMPVWCRRVYEGV